jgi:hypothetical protein
VNPPREEKDEISPAELIPQKSLDETALALVVAVVVALSSLLTTTM